MSKGAALQVAIEQRPVWIVSPTAKYLNTTGW